MELAGLILLFSGGLLQWCALTGRSPLAVIEAIAEQQPMPARNSWAPFVSGAIIGPGGANTAGIVVSAAEGNAIGTDIGSAIASTAARQTVVAFAMAQVGKRYVWDTAGPTTFDCSGLSLAAYRLVGINLPHLAAAQQKIGKSISLTEIQPGDLVFWNTPASHVGIYVGNGNVVDAYSTADGVRLQPLWDKSAITVKSILPNPTPVHYATTPGL